MSEHGSENIKPQAPMPVVGHGGTAYEASDAHSSVVVVSLAIIGGLAVLSFILMLGVQKYLTAKYQPGEMASPMTPERMLPPAPQVQVHPWEDLPEMRQAEKEGLAMSGTDKYGRMHMPIDSAITKVVSRLKVEPNAQRGITTPGGQGSEYSRSLADMPVRPAAQIQGEVVKNAQ